MIYILIFVWVTQPYDKSPQSSVVAEFNTNSACQAAAVEVRRQAAANTRDRSHVPLILCAAKGEKASQ